MNRKRVLRTLARVAASGAALALGLGTFVTIRTNQRLARRFEVPPSNLVVNDSPETLARGEHLVKALAKCVDCHGDDLGGKVMVDDAAVGTLAGPNITRGGLGKDLTTEDWVRAVLHGVGKDHRGLLAMPAEDYNALGKDDVEAIVAYARSVPAVSRTTPAPRLGPVMRVMMTTGSVSLIAAENVDHQRPISPSPRPEANVVYGEYLARTGGCFGCHGPTLAGGPIPGMPPGTPKATDLRPTGVMAKWSAQDFDNALRHGVRPDGTQLQAPMPWQATAQMSETEMKALYLFLKAPGTDRSALSQR